MRSATLVLFIFLSSLPAIPQDKEDSLSKDLQALHAKWFKAFDNGDGETMDNLETNNLVLVMPDGTIWPKETPRAGKQRKLDPEIERTLTQVSVRRFGSAAILTGILATRSPKQKDISKEATTVVFIESSGSWRVASAQWATIGK